jgi:hypothetical protein
VGFNQWRRVGWWGKGRSMSSPVCGLPLCSGCSGLVSVETGLHRWWIMGNGGANWRKWAESAGSSDGVVAETPLVCPNGGRLEWGWMEVDVGVALVGPWRGKWGCFRSKNRRPKGGVDQQGETVMFWINELENTIEPLEG